MKLAELFVEFSAKGVEGISKATSQVKGQLDGIVASAGNVGSAMSSALGGGIAGGAMAMGGMAMAGIAGSGQAEAITNTLGMISRELGSVFLPIVELVSGAFMDLLPVAGMFADLLQPSIQALSDALGGVWKAVMPLIESLAKAEAAWLGTIAEVVGGFVNLLLPVIELAAGAFKWWVDMVRDVINWVRRKLWMSEIDSPKGQARRLAPRSGGFEDVQAAYARIAQASMKMSLAGRSAAEQHLDVAQQQLTEQQTTNRQLGRLRPAFA